MRRRMAVLASVAAVTACEVIATAPPASAAPPITSMGIYLKPDNNIPYNTGCFFGAAQAQQAGGQTFLATLQMGDPMTSGSSQGATMHTNSFQSTAVVQGATKNFAKGWWDCNNTTDNDNLYIAVGPTNHGSAATVNNGQAFGLAVEAVQGYLQSQGFTADISVRGGIDAELGFNSFNATYQWWLGHKSKSDTGIYNGGDANGCTESFNCWFGWTRENVWTIAHDAATPQIYNASDMANDWYQVALWASQNGHFATFRGSLSQHTACHQPGQSCPAQLDSTPLNSWNWLYLVLQQNAGTAQTPMFMSDFMWT
jgi:hypothetical protein